MRNAHTKAGLSIHFSIGDKKRAAIDIDGPVEGNFLQDPVTTERQQAVLLQLQEQNSRKKLLIQN